MDGWAFSVDDRLGARERLGSAIAVAAIHAAMLYALFTMLGIDVTKIVDNSAALKMFAVADPIPPSSPERPIDEEAPAEEGASSPQDEKARPTPVVAPELSLPIPVSPIIAAPKPRDGADRDSGATVAGPGDAAGGAGDGTGSGNEGTGQGGGGTGDGTGAGFTPTEPRLIRGRISNKDYPDAASRAGVGGTVTAWYRVDPDGRVRDCEIARSSGNSALDNTTCRLIEKRFRYEPARGRDGKAVAAETGWKQIWWLEGRGGRIVATGN